MSDGYSTTLLPLGFATSEFLLERRHCGILQTQHYVSPIRGVHVAPRMPRIHSCGDKKISASAHQLWCFEGWDTDDPMRIPSILRQDLSRMAHIGIAAGIGIAAAAVVGVSAGWRFSTAAGWIATASVYLIWVWASIARMSAAAIEVVVQQRHPARRSADLIVLTASVASLGGVGHLLIAGSSKGPDATVAAAVGFLSVIASWLVVHAVYTVRYPIVYYTEPVGGVDFNDDTKPTFADFAYLAFTVAVTYGVTDTLLQKRSIRVAVLQHAMVSYLFGTVILAVTVQVIGSLNGL